jgi:hypothetical protein
MKILVGALFCKTRKGTLIYDHGGIKSQVHGVQWDKWETIVKENKPATVYICPDSFIPFLGFETREWAQCGCWEKTLSQVNPKLMAMQFCYNTKGALVFEGRREYVNWEAWKALTPVCNSVWMCKKALEEYGRPVQHVHTWVECSCYMKEQADKK